jgi:predicted AlkP superfamily phosphohydrolase/phosphomutase
MTPKVFLLGLDGATWRLLDVLMERGLMPNLKALVESGASGPLNSTIPYVTPVAWTSLLTGTKPGKHCIFGYTVTENREGVVLSFLANRTRMKAPTVMDMYCQLRRRMISLNMPMTYPPREEDGIITSGMMTPSSEGRFFYPLDLMDELKARGIDYKIDIRLEAGDESDLEERLQAYLADDAAAFFADLKKVTKAREETVLYLMADKEWDLFQVNFISMDRIQHYLWREVTREGDSAVKQRAYEHYAYVDSIIGRIVEGIKGRATLVICSDHGFGNVHGNFYPTVWLKNLGYYSEVAERQTPWLLLKSVLKKLGISRRLRRALEKSDKSLAKKLIYVGTSKVDWKRTKAYAYVTNGLRINVRGRDQFGIVEPGAELEAFRKELEQKLMGLEDGSGEKIMKAVHFVDALYGVSGLEEAPDLFFEFDDDHFYTAYYHINQAPGILDGGYSWRQGDHRRDGIFLVAGEGVIPGKKLAADIEDILPTIFYMQDLPQSDWFDGRVLEEIFSSDYASARKSPSARHYEPGSVEAPDEEDSDEVVDRLKGLGYI